MLVLGFLRRLRPIVRVTIALALFALQGALVSATIWEPTGTVTSVLHVEELGAQHLDMHNEQACAVCQLRTLVAAPGKSQTLPDARTALHTVPVSTVSLGAARGATSSVRSRAPPQKG